MSAAPTVAPPHSASGWSAGPWGALLAAALFYAVTNAYWWDRAWDDMAITLGFARTLADTGAFAPTPLSDPVEGTSTLLWTLVNAVLYKLHGEPAVLFVQAKLFAIAFLVMDVGLVYAAAIICGVTRPLALIVSLTFAASSPATIESVNGMENPVFLFVYGLAFISYFSPPSRPARLVFLLSSSLVPFVRWESIWFLLPFVLINGWRFGLRGLFARQHWLWLLLFLGQTLRRLLTFGDWIPNAIRAKTHAPYSADGPGGFGNTILALGSHLKSELEPIEPFIAVVLVAIAVSLVIWLLRRQKEDHPARAFVDAIPWPVRLAIAIVGAGGIFTMITGGNWGYRGRMFFVVLPFLLIILVWALERIAVAGRMSGRRVLLVVGVSAVLTISIGVRNAYRHLSHNIITVAQIRRILPVLDAVKQLTGRPTLTVAHPDLGAVMLYGDGIRIVDTALLCNAPLARSGYSGFESEIFDRERPDVIQTHGVWTQISRIGAMKGLYTDYAPIFVEGVRLFMRRSILAGIPEGMLERREFAPDGTTRDYDKSLLWTRHARPADFAINRRFRYYWAPTASATARPEAKPTARRHNP